MEGPPSDPQPPPPLCSDLLLGKQRGAEEEVEEVNGEECEEKEEDEGEVQEETAGQRPEEEVYAEVSTPCSSSSSFV